METTPAFFYLVNVFAEHPGGCYTCRRFGERRDCRCMVRTAGLRA
jgi:hypothetical protein